MVPQGELDPVNPFTYMRLVKYVNELNKKYNYKFPFCSIFPRRDAYATPIICSAGITRAVIEVDGSVCGCPYLADYKVGNLKNERFLYIWQNGNWTFYRKLKK